jgi:hypothetical protein
MGLRATVSLAFYHYIERTGHGTGKDMPKELEKKYGNIGN